MQKNHIQHGLLASIILLTLFALITPASLQADESQPPLSYRQTEQIRGVFAWLMDIEILPDGRMYAWDHLRQEINVFGPDETLVQTVSMRRGEFYSATTFAVDSSEKIYILDRTNTRLLVFNEDFSYSTSVNLATEEVNLRALAVDPDDKIYIIINDDVTILNSDLTPYDTIYTSNQLSNVRSITIADDGMIYVAAGNSQNADIYIYDSNFAFQTTLRTGHDGDVNYDLESPHSVDILRDGKIAVNDTSLRQVKLFNSDLSYFGTIGSGEYGINNDDLPAPVSTVMSSSGVFYVADAINMRVQIFDHNLNYARTLGVSGSPMLELIWPTDIVVDHTGNIIVTTYMGRMNIYDQDLTPTQMLEIGDSGDQSTVTVDHDGNIYVVGGYGNKVLIYNSDFNEIASISGYNSSNPDASFDNTEAIAVDLDGKIYVATYDVVKIFSSDLEYLSTFGGHPTNANYQFYGITDIVFDNYGNLIVSDGLQLRVYDSALNYVRTIGSGIVDVDESGPGHVAVGIDGKLYVLKHSTETLYVFDSNFNFAGAVDLVFGIEIFVDSSNRIYVPDYVNNVVTIFSPNTAPIASPDTYSATAGQTLTVDANNGVLSNDGDPEFDPLTATLITAPSHVQIFNMDAWGGFTYVPEAGFTGQDSFTYQASDGLLMSDVTTVTISVNESPSVEVTFTNPPEPTAQVTNTPTDEPTEPTATIQPTADPLLPPSAPKNLTVDPRFGRPEITWADDVQAEWFRIYIGNADYSAHLLDAWIERAEYCENGMCSIIPPIDPLAGTYHVWMQAWGYGLFSTGGDTGTDGWSHTQFTLPDTPPGPANGLTTTVSNGKISLMWQAETSATWYNIWLGTGAPDWSPSYFGWMNSDDLKCDTGLCTLNTDITAGDYVWYVTSWGPGGFNTGGMPDAPGWVAGPDIRLN